MPVQTPVALIIFNRPDLTAQVVAALRQVQPRRLLVVADGPRTAEEQERTDAARAVIETIDWECEITRRYADSNLGCKRSVSGGLDWVFSLVEEAIILEDDCVPAPSFFPYCAELLEKYRQDDRVMMVAGTNLHPDLTPKAASYYFSHFNYIWGWATWRRAWQKNDVTMQRWAELNQLSWLKTITGDSRTAQKLHPIFQNAFEGGVDTWDFQWSYSCWLNHGLSIVPSANLISNIGFGAEATHTRTPGPYMNRLRGSLPLPLTTPVSVERKLSVDRVVFARMLGVELSKIEGVKRKFFKFLRTLLKYTWGEKFRS